MYIDNECPQGPPNAVLTCVLGGAVVAKGKNRDAQISQVENFVRSSEIKLFSFSEYVFTTSIMYNGGSCIGR